MEKQAKKDNYFISEKILSEGNRPGLGNTQFRIVLDEAWWKEPPDVVRQSKKENKEIMTTMKKSIIIGVIVIITAVLSVLWWTERQKRLDLNAQKIILEYDLENIIKEKARLTGLLEVSQVKVQDLQLDLEHASTKTQDAKRSLRRIRKDRDRKQIENEELIKDISLKYDNLDDHVRDSLRTEHFGPNGKFNK